MVSAGLVRITRIGPGRCFAAIRRGPATRRPEDLPAVLALLEARLRGLGAIVLAVGPHWSGEEAAEVTGSLERAGYRRVPAIEQTLPTATAIIDLTRSPEELRARLSQRRRRELRQCEEHRVTVRPVASEDEAAALSAILREMAAETDMEIDGQHDFTAHYRYLAAHPADGAIRAAFWKETLFGGMVSYREGDRMCSLLMATSPRVKEIPRATALFWSDIVGAKQVGCTQYDMVGFPDPDLGGKCEGDLRRGEFKAGFGPEIVKLVPIMSKPLRPLDHAVFSRLRGLYRGSDLKRSLKPLLHRVR